MAATTVLRVTATSMTGAAIVDTRDTKGLVLTSDVLSRVLAIALHREAAVELEMFDASPMIRRINAFDVRRKPPTPPEPIKDVVSRLATQWSPRLGKWLEVFVYTGDINRAGQYEEKSFNVYDEDVQTVCLEAAHGNRPLGYEAIDGVILKAWATTTAATIHQ